jgi:ectoine hydroxylase-related dioxygenase (phytanoyl-CoA dioxygenase family)
METRPLSSPLEAHYREHGFVLVPALLPPEVVATLERWIGEIAVMTNRAGLFCYYEANGFDLRQIENACAVRPDLEAFAAGGRLLQAASQLLGEPARLFKDKINFKPAGGAGYEAHRDGRFWWTSPDGTRLPGWDVYARDFISVLISVDACTPANGCLELAAGRHRRADIGDDYGPLTEHEAATMTFEPCPTVPGDVIFFNALAPHRSGPNLTLRPRRALYLTYNPALDGDQRARYFEDKQQSLARGATNR